MRKLLVSILLGAVAFCSGGEREALREALQRRFTGAEKEVNEVDSPMLALGEEIQVNKPSEDDYEVDLSEIVREVAAEKDR